MIVGIDSALEAAVIEVVREAGQPEAVASRILAWLKAGSAGELSIDDNEQLLMLTRNAIVVGEVGNAD